MLPDVLLSLLLGEGDGAQLDSYQSHSRPDSEGPHSREILGYFFVPHDVPLMCPLWCPVNFELL